MKKRLSVITALCAAAIMSASAFSNVYAADDKYVPVQPEGKEVWTTSTDIASSFTSDDGLFSVNQNYEQLFYGTGRSLILQVKTTDSAQITGVKVKREVKGKWTNAAVASERGLTVSHKKLSSENPVCEITLTPDLYFKKAVEGNHKVVITLKDSSGKDRQFSFGFTMTANAVVSSEKEYDPSVTKQIVFTTNLNTECELYPQINELYFKEDGKWHLVMPRSGKEIASKTRTVKSGTFESTLDLTRYNTNNLKSGKYMVYVGDDVAKEFELRRSIDVKTVQVRDAYAKKVRFTFTNHSSSKKMGVTEFGRLWVYQKANGKKEWVELSAKGSTKIGLNVTRNKFKTHYADMTAAYGVNSKGSYRIEVKTDDGRTTYAYFNIVE